MQRKTSKIFLILGILFILILAITLVINSSWKNKSEQAIKATTYLENYYSANAKYPSKQEFYKNFDKELMYDSTSKHHFILEYKTNKIHSGAFGNPYKHVEMFTNEIRYYISSCDTSRRCNWRDFSNLNLINGSHSPIHNKSAPYSLIDNLVYPIQYHDQNLRKIYTYNWKISFLEKDKGKTYLYKNLTYDPLFYSLEQTYKENINSLGELYDKRVLNPTGKEGETIVSYDLIFCENISVNDCDSPIHIEMLLELYNQN